jgi:predicted GNAT family acetyltransferase
MHLQSMSSHPCIHVVHDTALARFEVRVVEQLCVADYRLLDGVMHMTHTFVPQALEGRGIASALVCAAFDHARTNGYHVNPVCSYVAAWAKRHPEVLPLLT